MSSIVLGLCLGYGLAFVLGKVDIECFECRDADEFQYSPAF